MYFKYSQKHNYELLIFRAVEKLSSIRLFMMDEPHFKMYIRSTGIVYELWSEADNLKHNWAECKFDG